MPRQRPEQRAVAIGLHAVEAVIGRSPERIDALYVRRGKRNARLEKAMSRAKQAGIPVRMAEPDQLDRLAEGQRHQGIVAEYRAAGPLDERDLMTLLDQLDEPPFLLILDGVTDPHNLGACLRSADAVGVHAVIAPRDQAAGLTPAARKTASGAAESVPFVQVANLGRALSQLRDRGVWITGATDSAPLGLHDHDLTGPLAIVLGAEGKGLRRKTLERCDFLVSIPMRGQVESLNVSVAAGVMLYEALRQRLTSATGCPPAALKT